MQVTVWILACGAVLFAEAPKGGKNPIVDYNAPAVTKDQTMELADYISAYQEGAVQGDPESQYNLGAAYRLGVGLPQDPEKAVQWIRKSADKGYVKAQFVLGTMYEKGEGVPQNDSEAMRWYKEASKHGDEEAAERFAALRDRKTAP